MSMMKNSWNVADTARSLRRAQSQIKEWVTAEVMTKWP